MGRAYERDVDLVLRDVKEGYVSIEGASRHYGVTVKEQSSTLEIDERATKRLREANS